MSKSGTGFLVRINTLELRGASTSATLQLSHSDDFGELRHKVAAKVSRVHDAPFIVVAVVVQGYQAANVMLNANTQRHANLTASSGLFNSNLNHLPLDTENVYETLQYLHLLHNGREVSVVARDRRMHARVIPDGGSDDDGPGGSISLFSKTVRDQQKKRQEQQHRKQPPSRPRRGSVNSEEAFGAAMTELSVEGGGEDDPSSSSTSSGGSGGSGSGGGGSLFQVPGTLGASKLGALEVVCGYSAGGLLAAGARLPGELPTVAGGDGGSSSNGGPGGSNGPGGASGSSGVGGAEAALMMGGADGGEALAVAAVAAQAQAEAAVAMATAVNGGSSSGSGSGSGSGGLGLAGQAVAHSVFSEALGRCGVHGTLLLSGALSDAELANMVNGGGSGSGVGGTNDGKSLSAGSSLAGGSFSRLLRAARGKGPGTDQEEKGFGEQAVWCMSDGEHLYFLPHPNGLPVPGNDKGGIAGSAAPEQSQNHAASHSGSGGSSASLGSSSSSSSSSSAAGAGGSGAGSGGGEDEAFTVAAAGAASLGLTGVSGLSGGAGGASLFGGLDYSAMGALPLDAYTEIRVVHSGDVLIKAPNSSNVLASSGKGIGSGRDGSGAGGGGGKGGTGAPPPPPISQHFKLSIVSHSGARCGVEPRAFVQHRGAATVRALTQDPNQQQQDQGEQQAQSERRRSQTMSSISSGKSMFSSRFGSSTSGRESGCTFNSGGGSGSGSGGGGGAMALNPKPDGGVVLCSLELGPEATEEDLGAWVRVLSSGRAFTKFNVSASPEFAPRRVVPPPTVAPHTHSSSGSTLAAGVVAAGMVGSNSSAAAFSLDELGNSNGGNRGSMTSVAAAADAAAKIGTTTKNGGGGGLKGYFKAVATAAMATVEDGAGTGVDLMGMCDDAIASAEREVSVRDACAVGEAALGLAGTLRYQPLRSAFKRRLKERVADENLLFWCHAQDYRLAFDRRDKEQLAAKAVKSAVDGKSSISSSVASSKGDGSSSGWGKVRNAAMGGSARGRTGSTNIDEMLGGGGGGDGGGAGGANNPATNSSSSNLKGMSKRRRRVFEGGVSECAEETCREYLSTEGMRRVAVGICGSVTEAQVAQVLTQVADTKQNTARMKSGSGSGSSGGAGTGLSPSGKPKPPPPPPPPAKVKPKPPPPPPKVAVAAAPAAVVGPRTCNTCTFLNESTEAKDCEMCGSPLPKPKPKPPPPPPKKVVVVPVEGAVVMNVPEALKAPRACTVCSFLNEKPAAIVCEMCTTPLPDHPPAPPPPQPQAPSNSSSSSRKPLTKMEIKRMQNEAQAAAAAAATGTAGTRTAPSSVAAAAVGGVGLVHGSDSHVFAGVAQTLFQFMESGDDFTDFCRDDAYRSLLLAVPAHLRANRRGQLHPLAPRIYRPSTIANSGGGGSRVTREGTFSSDSAISDSSSHSGGSDHSSSHRQRSSSPVPNSIMGAKKTSFLSLSGRSNRQSSNGSGGGGGALSPTAEDRALLEERSAAELVARAALAGVGPAGLVVPPHAISEEAWRQNPFDNPAGATVAFAVVGGKGSGTRQRGISSFVAAKSVAAGGGGEDDDDDDDDDDDLESDSDDDDVLVGGKSRNGCAAGVGGGSRGGGGGGKRSKRRALGLLPHVALFPDEAAGPVAHALLQGSVKALKQAFDVEARAAAAAAGAHHRLGFMGKPAPSSAVALGVHRWWAAATAGELEAAALALAGKVAQGGGGGVSKPWMPCLELRAAFTGGVSSSSLSLSSSSSVLFPRDRGGGAHQEDDGGGLLLQGLFSFPSLSSPPPLPTLKKNLLTSALTKATSSYLHQLLVPCPSPSPLLLDRMRGRCFEGGLSRREGEEKVEAWRKALQRHETASSTLTTTPAHQLLQGLAVARRPASQPAPLSASQVPLYPFARASTMGAGVMSGGLSGWGGSGGGVPGHVVLVSSARVVWRNQDHGVGGGASFGTNFNPTAGSTAAAAAAHGAGGGGSGGGGGESGGSGGASGVSGGGAGKSSSSSSGGGFGFVSQAASAQALGQVACAVAAAAAQAQAHASVGIVGGGVGVGTGGGSGGGCGGGGGAGGGGGCGGGGLSSSSVGHTLNSGEAVESWAKGPLLNTYSSFSSVAPRYTVLLTEVAESLVPLFQAATSACGTGAAAKLAPFDPGTNSGGGATATRGRRDSTGNSFMMQGLAAAAAAAGGNNNGDFSEGSALVGGGKVSQLVFLRENTGEVERVVHLRDLLWCGPAIKPLHAISLGDAFGELGVMLLGRGVGGSDSSGGGISSGGGGNGSSGGCGSGSSGGGGSSGSSSSGSGGEYSGLEGWPLFGGLSGPLGAVTVRDQWISAIARAGGPRTPTSALSRVPLNEGVVRKKGGGSFVRWQGRRFILDYGLQTLRYYDESTGEFKGEIPLSTIEHITPGNDSYFTLVSKPTGKKVSKLTDKEKGTRVWDLQGASREDMLEWVGAVEQCLSLRRQHLRAQQAITMAEGHRGAGGSGVGGGAGPGGGSAGSGGARGPVRKLGR